MNNFDEKFNTVMEATHVSTSLNILQENEEYYVVRRGGHAHYESFLKNPNIKGWPDDEDFGSLRNAYKFRNVNNAHRFVRVHDEDFQGSVIAMPEYDLVQDAR